MVVLHVKLIVNYKKMNMEKKNYMAPEVSVIELGRAEILMASDPEVSGGRNDVGGGYARHQSEDFSLWETSDEE